MLALLLLSRHPMSGEERNRSTSGWSSWRQPCAGVQQDGLVAVVCIRPPREEVFRRKFPVSRRPVCEMQILCLKKVECPFLHLDKYWLAMESITALFKPYENSGVTRNKKLNVSLRSDLLQNFRHI